MVLFSNNPIRSAATGLYSIGKPWYSTLVLTTISLAAVVVAVAHYATKFISSNAFQLTQTSIAIMSISALLFMIMMHHKMKGEIMSQSQEEMAVIGIFALFWVVSLLGYKSMKGKQAGGGITGSALGDLGYPKVSQDSASPSNWQDPCSKDGVYCVYEEYMYF